MTGPHFLPTSRPVRLPAVRLVDLLSGAVAHCVARLGDRVHAEGDEFAAAEGWQVTRTRWGGRTYRHPGFVARQSDTGQGMGS